MSTGIPYNFNKETFMGTDPFQDLWNKTHNVPSTKPPVYEVDDYDEVVEDDYSEEDYE